MYFLSTKKVAVLTPLATNVTIRLNQMKLLIFDHIRPLKMAISCGTTLEKKLSFAYNDAFIVEGLRAKTNTIFCVDVYVWILQRGVSYGNC